MNKKIYTKIIILLIVAVLVSLGTYVYALEGKITEDSVNFRSEPKIDGENVMGSFKKGDVVEIISKDNIWFKVKDEKGRVGYASRKYIEEITEANKKPKKEEPKTGIKEEKKEDKKQEEKQKEKKEEKPKVKINAIKVKNDTQMCTLPIYYANKVGEIKKDEEIEIVDKIGTWTKIRNKVGAEGWILQSEIN